MAQQSNPSLYDADFYEARRPLWEEYRAMARVLHEVFAPKSCIDFGCGPGEIIGTLADLGTSVLGVDGSRSALDAANSRRMAIPILVEDLRTCTLRAQNVDLVLCLETAEHIPEGNADAMVSLVAGNVARWLVWSAAPPGQGGTGHINEQDEPYWVLKLETQGLRKHYALSRAMRLLFAQAAPRQPWYARTTMVLERLP